MRINADIRYLSIKERIEGIFYVICVSVSVIMEKERNTSNDANVKERLSKRENVR